MKLPKTVPILSPIDTEITSLYLYPGAKYEPSKAYGKDDESDENAVLRAEGISSLESLSLDNSVKAVWVRMAA